MTDVSESEGSGKCNGDVPKRGTGLGKPRQELGGLQRTLKRALSQRAGRAIAAATRDSETPERVSVANKRASEAVVRASTTAW